MTKIHTHDHEKCAGQYCCIHNPSDHPLKNNPLHWRADHGYMERICEHGIGHPDPDCIYAQNMKIVHGCDGCCTGKTIDVTPD